MATPFLMTYRDCIEHLCDFVDGLSEETAQRRARGSIHAAYREIGYLRKWKYLQTHGRITLAAPFTTGTMTYVASTKVATFTGTLPSWARYGHLKITGFVPVYKVLAAISGTTAQLESRFAPSADIATPTTFVLYQSTYALPADMISMEEIHDQTQFWSRGYVSAEAWMTLERNLGTTMKPFAWTIMGANDLIGSMQLCLHGYPSAEETLDFIYTRAPRAMRLDGYTRYSSQSAATATAAGTAVTVSANVDSDVIGAVFRMGQSGATLAPESINSQNRYVYQRMITARPTAVTLTLDSAIPTATVSTHFAISDPVDLPEYLIDAFLRACEYQMLLKTDPARAPAAAKVLYDAKRTALARDHMEPTPEGPMSGGRWSRDVRWASLTGTISAYPYS
jgi:hypothetical protein